MLFKMCFGFLGLVCNAPGGLLGALLVVFGARRGGVGHGDRGARAGDAEVAVLPGLHPKLGGPYKLVYLFRRLRCVHVYECLSQARRWWWSLHLATDARFCLRELQPSTGARKEPFPPWWRRGAGSPYPNGGPQPYLLNEERGGCASCVVRRDAAHAANLSGGVELFVDAARGDDTPHSGRSADDAFATLGRARDAGACSV